MLFVDGSFDFRNKFDLEGKNEFDWSSKDDFNLLNNVLCLFVVHQ